MTKMVDLQKITFIRKNAGLTHEKVSKMLGYKSTNGYYYLENGRSKFSAEMLAEFADLFGVTIESLFKEID
jgi:transcriptional regulator with XRE-family HTH domain